MADKNIKMKIRTATGWDQLYPETKVDLIVDASTVGKNLFKAATPTSNSFIKINTNGSISFLTPEQVRTDIGAASSSHTHTTSQITDLSTVLAAKADLDPVSNKIVLSQLPDFVFGGLKYAGSKSTNFNIIDIVSTLDQGVINQGNYWVATEDITITNTDPNVIFQVLGPELGSAGGVTLQKGDWLVFVEYRVDNSKYVFSVVNNTYNVAGTSETGIVALSAGTAVRRSQLSSTFNPMKTIDEKALRNVLKDIWYETSEAAASAALVGDILFQG
jgi:hypothetical protein